MAEVVKPEWLRQELHVELLAAAGQYAGYPVPALDMQTAVLKPGSLAEHSASMIHGAAA